MTKFVNEITPQLVDIGKKIKSKPSDNHHDEDDEYEDEDELDDEDVDYSDYISTEITKCLHEIFSHHGVKVLALLNEKVLYYYSFILSVKKMVM